MGQRSIKLDSFLKRACLSLDFLKKIKGGGGGRLSLRQVSLMYMPHRVCEVMKRKMEKSFIFRFGPNKIFISLTQIFICPALLIIFRTTFPSL